MTFWARVRRLLTNVDVDEDGKEFPAWKLREGERCLKSDCLACEVASCHRTTSRCYGAISRSQIRHYAKYKVNRRFSA